MNLLKKINANLNIRHIVLLIVGMICLYVIFNKELLIVYSILHEREIYIHLMSSLRRVVVGFFVSVILGIGIGMSLGLLKKNHLIRFCIELLRPIPPIARIPLAILRFGLGDYSSYFIVFIGSFFPIFTNTYFGITSMPKIYLEAAVNLNLTKFDYYYNILRKYALPYVFSGLKIGLGMGWMSLIAAELIGAQSGLGYYIQINRLLLNTENIIVGMIFIGAIGFGLNYGLTQIEKSLIRWKE